MAVELNLTLTNAEALRVARACGIKNGLRNAQGTQRDATEAEVEQDLGRYIKGYVRAIEAQEVADAAIAAVTDVNPA